MESADKGTNSNSEIRGSDRIDTRTPLLRLLLTLSFTLLHVPTNRITVSPPPSTLLPRRTLRSYFPPENSPCTICFEITGKYVVTCLDIWIRNGFTVSWIFFFSFREDSFFHGSRSLDPLDVRRDFSLSGGNLLAERVSRP